MKTALVLILLCTAFFSGVAANRYFIGKNPGATQTNAQSAAEEPGLMRVAGGQGTEGPVVRRFNEYVQAIGKASPSVVFIGVTQVRIYANPLFNDPFFRQFFPPYVQEFQSMGSGVIVTASGHIITNYHVIENASRIEVHCQSGATYEAKGVGSDPFTDLAVIKIEGKGLPAITMCPNDSIYIGEWTAAIGNPFGGLIDDNKPTVTVGVVSAMGRQFTRESGIGTKYKDMIQTDAAINPGNSGGALINCLGELIGINTFIFTQDGGNVGIGFAIPVGRVQKTLKEIIKYGKIRSFNTGISVQNINEVIAQSMGLKDVRGVIINGVEKKSLGARAGLATGDIITQVDRYKVFDTASIQEIFNQYLPGDTATVFFVRNRKEKQARLAIEATE
ncbi:MAG: hypothetical protein A2350_11690 [Candidatus Raymondbacteria bacterium RifOxyB12_full_50_8]|uniref:PDZ domain-containing protein n=1 Tax=Candidatus Raymondbacteria bacterium RIFOXYD12_FULL_49_13 TaxID=1817890 RepID=A0A1F7FFW1_UNCRA|nr:MAG: hypothetical protein A2248_22545 [Candidatus Raymondbacteria bacterium RIFOXYA2_FULL_49_16]OGK01030.1 MAG: hypothetical protein A2350_11690 [Candidatus Raymondbacteria bacterium RifOxyB12_full_50_8]OGK05352.1 MAG: hypothetical protein A2519_03495 [Candidatus Raymondbacteria bacterium RIFOXYD12_FULL_49_13]OGP42965.1 MAG: hypothetical protein A2324_16200 [Candidatus Raymondbacteria bacterium RIFOXYB2_FULL_49_35]